MQTINVTLEPIHRGTEFSTGYKAIARVRQDTDGTFYASFGVYARGNNFQTYADAVEFVGDAICRHFENFGLNVQFN